MFKKKINHYLSWMQLFVSGQEIHTKLHDHYVFLSRMPTTITVESRGPCEVTSLYGSPSSPNLSFSYGFN